MAVNLTEEEYDILGRALEFEKSLDEETFTLGWHWHDISVPAYKINKLIYRRLLRVSYKSNNDTRYRLTDEGSAILATGGYISSNVTEDTISEPKITVTDMFSDIVGYDDIKELLIESLQLDDPIHVLLHSPPALAKTMFLWDIERTFGEQAMTLLGSATSHAGLWDMVAEVKPRVLLVDELDKMSLIDHASLLSLMETGRLIRAKVGRKLDIKIKVWVIAAANRVNKLPAELLSRFSRFQLEEYTASEFRQVVRSVLQTREGLDDDTAAAIATRLVGKTHDVRDAVRVARLSKRVGVKRAAELLIR